MGRLAWIGVMMGTCLVLYQLSEEGEVSAAQARPQLTQFAGYEWQIKSSEGGVGPGPNVFGDEGVSVDSHGRLHLGVAYHGGHWISSELVSERAFGYGTYSFTVHETADMDANAVLGLFTWDDAAPDVRNRELDIEISRWGDPNEQNGQFAVNPYSRTGNLERFSVPRGRVDFSLRWTPGRLECRASAGGKLIRKHVFTEGIPEPGRAKVRMNLWLYRGFPPLSGRSMDIVIERFRFTPIDNKKGN